jgi:DNA polymerase elongation subunit (family B)
LPLELFVIDAMVVDAWHYDYVTRYSTEDFRTYGKVPVDGLPSTVKPAPYMAPDRGCLCLITTSMPDGTACTLQLTGFRPHFILSVPDSWTDTMTQGLVFRIHERCKYPMSHYAVRIIHRHFYFGYVPTSDTSSRLFKCLRIETHTLQMEGELKERIVSLAEKVHVDETGERCVADDDLFQQRRSLFSQGESLSDRQLYELFSVVQYQSAFRVLETCYNIEPEHKLLEALNVTPCGWLRVNRAALPSHFVSHSEVELLVRLQDVTSLPDKMDIAPLRIASFDIETYTPKPQQHFGTPKNKEDAVICVGTAVDVLGTDPTMVEKTARRHVHYVRPSRRITTTTTTEEPTTHGKKRSRNEMMSISDDEGTAKRPATNDHRTVAEHDGGAATIDLQFVDSEADCFLAWRDFMLLDVGCQIRVGYNIYRYDDGYMAQRVLLHYIPGIQTAIQEMDEARMRNKTLCKESLPMVLENRYWSGMSFWRMSAVQRKKKRHVPHGLDAMQQSPMFQMSPYLGLPTPLQQFSLKSDAFGDNCYAFWNAPGIMSLDLLPYFKIVQRSFSSYRLDYVSKALLGDQKDDLSTADMCRIYEQGDMPSQWTVAHYCVQDCMLVLRLLLQRRVLYDLMGQARQTWTTVQRLMTCGQMAKSWNVLVQKAHSLNYVMNQSPTEELKKRCRAASTLVEQEMAESNEKGYDGGHVMDPIVGYYGEDVFTPTLDFASLYPSIMQSLKLCYATLLYRPSCEYLLDRKGTPAEEMLLERLFHRYVAYLQRSTNLNLRAIPRRPTDTHFFEQLQCPIDPSEKDPLYHYFVTSVDGVIPCILQEMKRDRSAVKKQMASMSSDQELYQILDKRQQAIKVSMNSLYGVFGASGKGQMNCVPIAETVTRVGREMILQTKELVETWYKDEHATVIYGDTDSVMVVLPSSKNEGGMAACMAKGETMAQRVTAYFRSQGLMTVELTFEKIYQPYYLQGKKHYAGLKWTAATFARTQSYDGPDVKGLVTVRRDAFPALRRCLSKAVDRLLFEKDAILAVNELVLLLHDIVDDRLPLDDYILTSGLKSTYKNNTNPPVQVVVNNKRKQRLPGSEYDAGTRVPYIFVRRKDCRKVNMSWKGSVQELAEDPDWVKQHPLEYGVARDHYIHLAQKPIEHVLSIIFDRNSTLLLKDAKNKVEQQILRHGDCFGTWRKQFPVEDISPAKMEKDLYVLRDEKDPQWIRIFGFLRDFRMRFRPLVNARDRRKEKLRTQTKTVSIRDFFDVT